LLGCQPSSRIRNFKVYPFPDTLRSNRENATLRHCVHRIQHKVRECPMQELRISRDRFHSLLEFQLTLNGRVIAVLKLRLKQSGHAPYDLVAIDPLELRFWHLRKLTEARDDRFQVVNLSQQRGGALPKNLLEDFRTLLPRAHQVFDSELQGKQGILKLMRESSGQCAPCRDSLRLDQSLLLRQEFPCHAIERLREFSHFVG